MTLSVILNHSRSKLVMIVENNVQKLRWPAKSLDLNHIDHLLDLLKRKVHVHPLQLNTVLIQSPLRGQITKSPAFETKYYGHPV